MSTNPSPFGAEPFPADDGATEVVETSAPVRERTPVDPRVLRSLLAGAAVVAVLGAGTAGFLWISSTPSGDVADAALGGARSTPSVAGPVRATGIAFGQREVFATSGGTGTGSDDVVTGTGTGTDFGPASGGGRPVTSPTTAPSSVRPAGPVVPARTTAPAPRPSTSGAPSVVPPPAVTAPASSAPGWVTPVVRFVGGTAGSGTFDIDGETRTFTTGQAVYPLGVVYAGVVLDDPSSSPTPSSSASATTEPPKLLGVLLTAGDRSTGWIVPPGTALPDVVVGRTQGRARVIGLLREQYFLRVDRRVDVLQAVGTAVAGTSLTFTGETNDVHTRWAVQAGDPSLARGDVYFSDGAVISFGRFGAGEADGVSY